MLKSSPLLPLLLTTLISAGVSAQKDYFFLYTGGNPTTTSQRLRTNTSDLNFLTPGVPPQPHNPADHFARIHVSTSACSSQCNLTVVPTNPHPPPVPGYYGLNDQEGVPDAYRLVYTYRLEEQGEGFKYTEWVLKAVGDGNGGSSRTLLRYAGDEAGEWRWIAVKEKTPFAGVDKWVPWYVRPSAGNVANLTAWEYDVVELELVEAKGPVNSNAPGGVEE